MTPKGENFVGNTGHFCIFLLFCIIDLHAFTANCQSIVALRDYVCFSKSCCISNIHAFNTHFLQDVGDKFNVFRCMLFKFSYEFQIYPGYLQSDELTISFKVVLRVSLFTGTICACQ